MRTRPCTTKVVCTSCNFRTVCLPANLDPFQVARFNEVVTTQKKLVRGHKLFQSGDKFHAIYAIHSGTFKTSFISSEGREQITGFQITGEINGLDGVLYGHHTCDATALEDADVCVIDYKKLEALSREISELQRQLHKVFSGEISRYHSLILVLGSMRAEARIATFLINYLYRLRNRGFSSSEFILRMSREDIGSYLGMKIETVSRTFARLIEDGIIEVHLRHVRIINKDKLRKMAELQVQ